MAEQKRLMLIDGHALAFRAFHALANADLRTSSGEPTYAVFGFVQILLTAIQEQHPHYVAVAFDIGRTFRDELYAEYKAGRAETPEEFHPQLARMKEMVQALNIPIYTAEGYEADDVIGTLARQATAAGVDTVILTGDTDTLQLVNEHVFVMLANPYGQKTTTTLYDEEKVHERYKGLKPGQLADLRGLKGDKSDNIPGVKGIGEDGAIALLNQFGNIEALYERLDEAPARYRKKLAGQQQQALFSKQLSVIVCDAPVTLDLAAARIDDYERNTVIGLFQQLEFGKSLLDKLPTVIAPPELLPLPQAAPELPQNGGSRQLSLFETMDGEGTPLVSPPAWPAPKSPAAGNYRSVTTEDDLRDLVHELSTAAGFAFDIESTGLDALTSDIVGIALATQPGAAWYVPVQHRMGEQLPRQHVLNTLRPFFANAGQAKYAHHARFDMELLEQAGLAVEGLTFDTLLAARLLGKQRIGLKELAFYELKIAEPMTEIEDLIGRGKKQITFDQVPIEHATPYAAADADMTLRLTETFAAQLASNEQLQHIFSRLEMPLVPIVVAMERAGIGIDSAYLQRLSSRLGERIAGLEEQIYQVAGQRFNINSGSQLGEVLFDRLKLPTSGLSKTATGRYSLSADALEKLAESLQGESQAHAIVPLILQHRQLSKLKSTYVDALPGLVNPRTGRIHTSYNQIGTATGRLSSSNPNLQNIPVRTEEGSEIRRAFVARPGCVFVAADYSQIELRVLAHITGDQNLVQVFREGQDIHAATAAQLFGINPDQVDKNQRRIAKTVVFGVIYGISSFGLSQRTSLSRGEAQALINALFARFPGIRAYIEQTLEQGRRDGYVQSLFGRRRYMPELNSKGPRRQAAEREAVNAPIQSTAADIMKLAMISVAHEFQRRKLATQMLLQVHDELIFETPLEEVATVQQVVCDLMEHACELQVPLKVDIEMGSNWEEMETIPETRL